MAFLILCHVASGVLAAEVYDLSTRYEAGRTYHVERRLRIETQSVHADPKHTVRTAFIWEITRQWALKIEHFKGNRFSHSLTLTGVTAKDPEFNIEPELSPGDLKELEEDEHFQQTLAKLALFSGVQGTEQAFIGIPFQISGKRNSNNVRVTLSNADRDLVVSRLRSMMEKNAASEGQLKEGLQLLRGRFVTDYFEEKLWGMGPWGRVPVHFDAEEISPGETHTVNLPGPKGDSYGFPNVQFTFRLAGVERDGRRRLALFEGQLAGQAELKKKTRKELEQAGFEGRVNLAGSGNARFELDRGIPASGFIAVGTTGVFDGTDTAGKVKQSSEARISESLRVNPDL